MSLPNFKELPGIKLASGTNDRVKIDLFLDLQCPYSKKLWDVISSFTQSEWVNQLNIFFHPICLSHHRQSWDLTRTLFAIKEINPSQTFSFINLLYTEQEQFYNANWKSQSQDDFLTHLSALAGAMIDVPTEEILKKIEDNQVYLEAKKSIHYAAVKQIWSAPSVLINDVPASALSSSSTIIEWNKIIDELKI